jgi:hypothetical protein
MQKCFTASLAMLLVLGMAFSASAIDFKASGAFLFAFDVIDGGKFMAKERSGTRTSGYQYGPAHTPRDNYNALHRIHLQLEAVASENLRGMVHFELGEYRWGEAGTGAALGADGVNVKVKNAFLEYFVPHTRLSLRMGLHDVQLPGLTLASPIFHDDVAALAASYAFSDQVRLTALWMRPFNDNWLGKASGTGAGFNSSSSASALDNMDLFVLSLPVRFDDMQAVPWMMGGFMGPNTIRKVAGGVDATFTNGAFTPAQYTPSQPIDAMQVQYGMYPAAFSSRKPVSNVLSSEYSRMFWAGATAQVRTFDPWIFSADFAYGNVNHNREYLNRAGWFGVARAEYVFSWGVPGLYIWYFSGDDGNVRNGSEAMPYIATTNNLDTSLSSFGYRGNLGIGGTKGILGTNPANTRGIGARLTKLSFFESISHTLRLHYFAGANDPQMASYITGRRSLDGGGRTVYRNLIDFNTFGVYLTTADRGVEVNFDTVWSIYDNLRMHLELGYIHLWLDNATWGKGVWAGANPVGNTLHYEDAWKASLNFYYTF